jgi:1-phosphofructokinase
VVSQGSHLPDLLKPNAEELASLTGDDWAALEADPHAAAAAAARLVGDGISAVLLTLGSQGAVLITADGCWRATPPPITLKSTVGAGDASLAGYLLADLRGLDAPDRLREAVAFGAAAASLPGSTMPRESDLHRDDVVVTELTAAL